jgi:hypothetical protein
MEEQMNTDKILITLDGLRERLSASQNDLNGIAKGIYELEKEIYTPLPPNLTMGNIDKLTELQLTIEKKVNELSLEEYYGNVPDWILAQYCIEILDAFKTAKHKDDGRKVRI